MTESELKVEFDKVMDYVVLGVTRINYLEQLYALINEKNHPVMVLQGFYGMVIRDANASLLISARKITETRSDTYNVTSLIDTIRTWLKEHRPDLFNDVNAVLMGVESHRALPVARKTLIMATTLAAHHSRRLPKSPTEVKYADVREWLMELGRLLNIVSGLLWDSSIVLETFDSSDDSFAREMRFIERAEIAGTYLIRRDENHEAVRHADDQIAKRRSKS